MKRALPKRETLPALLEQALPPSLKEVVKLIGRIAEENQASAFLVGGFVRDLILGLPNEDLDIVLVGNAVELAQKTARECGAKVTVHENFQTATLTWDRHHIDLAMARKENYPTPAALPVIEPASILADLERRDFTINTLLLRLETGHFGELFDVNDGWEDLAQGRLRILHDKSFIDDPTRIFRAVRFAVRFDFHLEERTLTLLYRAIADGYLERLAGSRIWKELALVFREPDPAAVLEDLAELSVLTAIDRALVLPLNVLTALPRFQPVADNFGENQPDLMISWWTVLVAHLKTSQRQSLAGRLELPENVARASLEYPEHIDRLVARLLKAQSAGPARMAALLRDEPVEVLFLVSLLSENKAVVEIVEKYLKDWSRVKPLISGHDLQKMGIPRGPLYREIIDAMRDARLNGQVETKEDELVLAEKFWQANS